MSRSNDHKLDYRRYWSHSDDNHFVTIHAPPTELELQQTLLLARGANRSQAGMKDIPERRLSVCLAIVLNVTALSILTLVTLGSLTIPGHHSGNVRNNDFESASSTVRTLSSIGLLNQLGPIPQTFARDISFHKISTWKRSYPTTKGYVAIRNPTAYGLSMGWPLNNTLSSTDPEYSEAYGIAMYHQLHCLKELKRGMAALLKGRDVPEERVVYDDCFDYLRQSILCQADTTIEPFAVVHNMLVEGVDGWGSVHSCKELKSLEDYLDTNSAY
ncbi:uncharacterized protein AB675_14 [Cyphellophora attinorum]|uniref:Oxidase ustYa n=1 Tax=Cyphellophora attinorum TaxID=1664694 RepID=A0A0N1NXQ4_9EURO|nr:uncharacterized protein AB675_14 [Phialophora attinorum]KPI34740.1 hypothetical protein AB675_14 [Phialophora attinorum]